MIAYLQGKSIMVTYEIHAFGWIHKLMDSIIGNTSPLGEMSTHVTTFSTNKTDVSSETYPGVHLTFMDCLKDGVLYPLPNGVENYLLGVVKTLATTFDSTIDFSTQLSRYFPTFTEVEYDGLTAMPGHQLPTVLRWVETVNGNDIAFNLYLGDSGLRNYYPEYEIRVVPPVPNILDMQSTTQAFQTSIDKYTPTAWLEDIRQLKDEDPETDIVTLKLKWIHRETKDEITASWTLLCYGPKALVKANQLKAIRDFLKDETGIIPPEWVELFPELEITTELNFFPLWYNVALKTTGSIPTLYASTFKEGTVTEVVNGFYQPTDPENVISVANIVPTMYKGAVAVVFPSLETIEPFMFSSIYPDYSWVGTNDNRIRHMDNATRNMIQALQLAMQAAERITEGMALDESLTYERSGDIVYVVTQIGSVRYRVATRDSVVNMRGA